MNFITVRPLRKPLRNKTIRTHKMDDWNSSRKISPISAALFRWVDGIRIL